MKLVIGGAFQGKEAYVKEVYGEKAEVLLQLHLRIRGWMQCGKEPIGEIEKYIEKYPEAIIICNEIGCGVIPLDAFEREYREKTGRIKCYLAKEAREVVRVVCGIGTILKKEEN